MNKDDWLQQSLKLVSENGVDVLKIDTLCKKLKVTKGSFYHHFKNHKNFIDSILDYWYKKYTLEIIDKIKTFNTEPLKQIELLNEVIYSKDLNIEIEFRAWKVKDNRIKKYIEKIDLARLEIIENIQNQLNPNFSKKQKQLASKYIYTQFIGSLFIEPKIQKEEQKELDEFLLSLMKGDLYDK